MAKAIKIFEDDNLIYEGALSVNTAILKGKLAHNPKLSGKVLQFSLQISNGKNPQTNEWNKSTYADCSAFGELAKQILDRYREKDDIWLIGKFYSNLHDGKFYKGFNVREVIGMKSEAYKDPNSLDFVGDGDIPF